MYGQTASFTGAGITAAGFGLGLGSTVLAVVGLLLVAGTIVTLLRRPGRIRP